MEMIKKSVAAMQQQRTWLSAVPVVRQACKVGLLGSLALAAVSVAALVAGTGWFGLRSHPRPSGSVSFGGPDLPGWLDGALRDIVGAPGPQEPERGQQRRAEERT